MSIVPISTPTASTPSYVPDIETDYNAQNEYIDRNSRGLLRISIANWYDGSTDFPFILAGSLFESHGIIYEVTSDTPQITASPTASRQFLIFNHDSNEFEFSTGTPLWSENLSGWYLGNYRFMGFEGFSSATGLEKRVEWKNQPEEKSIINPFMGSVFYSVGFLGSPNFTFEYTFSKSGYYLLLALGPGGYGGLSNNAFTYAGGGGGGGSGGLFADVDYFRAGQTIEYFPGNVEPVGFFPFQNSWVVNPSNFGGWGDFGKDGNVSNGIFTTATGGAGGAGGNFSGPGIYGGGPGGKGAKGADATFEFPKAPGGGGSPVNSCPVFTSEQILYMATTTTNVETATSAQSYCPLISYSDILHRDTTLEYRSPPGVGARGKNGNWGGDQTTPFAGGFGLVMILPWSGSLSSRVYFT